MFPIGPIEISIVVSNKQTKLSYPGEDSLKPVQEYCPYLKRK